jgi:uroporphyrinogen-III decarboxylase
MPFDYTLDDAQAMSIKPMRPLDFPLARYEDWARQCDKRYAEFLGKDQGVAVWQRVRVAEVFRDGCRDARQSLEWQLGGLAKSMEYASDVPTCLEPWYGIGITASAFGGEYLWPEGQAPVVKPRYESADELPLPDHRGFSDVPIMKHTLAMIEYFLEQTNGRVPICWTDLQSPLDVALEIVDASRFLLAFYEQPETVKDVLRAIADVIVDFTRKQSYLIGDALAQPGHGFASSYAGTAIGLSDDQMVTISPQMYKEFCVEINAAIGSCFGGTAIHSCGNWERWIETIKKIPNLKMVDAAFSPQTDPGHNTCEVFRDSLTDTGIILHARLVGDPEETLSRVKRLWAPGMKLVVVTYVQDPEAQNELYEDIHSIYS